MLLHKPLYLINYEDMFTKFTQNVYSYENRSLKNFVPILKNKMAAIDDCSIIINMF